MNGNEGSDAGARQQNVRTSGPNRNLVKFALLILKVRPAWINVVSRPDGVVEGVAFVFMILTSPTLA